MSPSNVRIMIVLTLLTSMLHWTVPAGVLAQSSSDEVEEERGPERDLSDRDLPDQDLPDTDLPDQDLPDGDLPTGPDL